MTLNFYLAMDAYFDIIINVDGFNEIAWPPVDNIPHGATPYFPRIWNRRIASGAEDRKLKALKSA